MKKNKHRTSLRTYIVAVCTYHRDRELERCLSAIDKQHVEFPGTQVMILVINNHPNPKTTKMVQALRRKSHFPIALIDERLPGISAARNAGLAYARKKKAEALVFLDDDDMPGPNLLTELIAAYHSTHADMITGPQCFHFPPLVPTFIRDCRVFKEANYANGKRICHAATNNLLIGRSVLDDTSLKFDLRFGKIGGGDFHFTRRCYLRGYSIRWCKAAVIHSIMPSTRIDPSWIIKRGYRVGSSWSFAILDLYGWKSIFIIPSYMGWRSLRVCKDLITGIFLWRPGCLCSAVFGFSQLLGNGVGAFKLTYREYA